MSEKRLLCIVSSMDTGGAETFLMKIYRNLNREKYQMDFCVSSDRKGAYDDEILSLGGKIHHSALKKDGIFKAFNSIKKTVKENNYKYVIRVNEHSLSVIDLIAAKCGGAKILAMRSSNAGSPKKISKFLHKAFKFLPKFVPDVKIAPSTEAAEYTFGKNSVKNGKVTLLHNAICVDDFLFSEENRKKHRDELNLDGKFVIGHIGRFSAQKNHSFLLDIFSEICKLDNTAHLVLVGKGELEEQIKEKAKTLGISDCITFTGVRSDVNELLSAFDVNVFPSFYEGMPNTVIEAQASGLNCVISDTITKEANITGLVSYLSLNDDAKIWAKKALTFKGAKRNNEKNAFVKSGYEIKTVAKEFENLIFN